LEAVSVAQIDAYLDIQRQNNASDFHLSPGHAPLYRIFGEITAFGSQPFSPQQTAALVDEILTPAQRAQFTELRDLDFAYEMPGVDARFRVNVYVERAGVCAAFRLIPSHIMTVEQLALPSVILEMIHSKKGLVLVTGATGSGKSTTMAALVDYINRTRKEHIVTIEDPIEFVHKSHKSLVNQREVGTHTRSFSAALRAALREDPDVISIGEMRDLETIELAVTAAETGHLVLATLHTSTAAKTVERIINVFDGGQQYQIRAMLADSLRGVISQSLVRTVEGRRVAAREILVGTPAVASLIREAKVHQIPSIMQTSKAEGMVLMDETLQTLVAERRVTAEEASKYMTGEGARAVYRPAMRAGRLV
jgi:twitching motility protein PilT